MITKEQKCIELIKKGYTYNPITGNVLNPKGEILKANVGKRKYKVIYVSIDKKQTKLRAHIFAWYWVHKEVVDCLDHINGDVTDNRISNLRSVTHSENQWNRHKKTNGFTYYEDQKRYKAQIRHNNKYIYLGYFKTEDEAKQAYLEAKNKLHVIQ